MSTPILLRWFIVALVLVALAALVSGWRYHGKPTLPASLAVGALAGFGGGAVQIGAPPLLVFWLGGANKRRHRARQHHGLFHLQGALACVLYFYGGLFTGETIALALLLGLPFARGDGRRRILVSRLERRALSPRRLRHHRACRH